MSDAETVRDDIYWLRLMIGSAFIGGADDVLLQACTAVLRGREERLATLEEAAPAATRAQWFTRHPAPPRR